MFKLSIKAGLKPLLLISAMLSLPAFSEVKTTSLTAESLAGCPSEVINAGFLQFGNSGKMPKALGSWLSDSDAQYIEPYQAFDGVYYVGVCWVSTWLIKTDDGAVLIDTGTGGFADQLVTNIKAVGVDPADIKLVLMTHGHFDHTGGASKIKALSNARFVMTEGGWSEALEDANKKPRGYWHGQFLSEADIIAKDGDKFTVGGQQFELLSTPGHTWGTASYLFDVKDGDKTYRAISIGGLGLNAIDGPAQVEAYINSVEKIEKLVNDENNPISVHLTAHPFSNGLTEASKRLKNRKLGEVHPFVDQLGLKNQLQSLKSGAQKRLVIESK